MKTTVICQHILKLSKTVARPHRAKRGKITLVCCHICAKLVCGPVADLVFLTAKTAGIEAKEKKIVGNRLDLLLEVGQGGIRVTRMERKKTARRVRPWEKPDVQVMPVEDTGPMWRVIKDTDRPSCRATMLSSLEEISVHIKKREALRVATRMHFSAEVKGNPPTWRVIKDA